MSWDPVPFSRLAPVPPSGQKGHGLWSMATPEIPPCTYAAKVYDRKRWEEAQVLDLSSMLRPKPPQAPRLTNLRGGVLSITHHRKSSRQSASNGNFQAGGSSPSSAQNVAGTASAPVDEAEARHSEPAAPTSVRALKRKSIGAGARASVVEGIEEKSIAIGDAKLKVTTSPSRKTVVIQPDISEQLKAAGKAAEDPKEAAGSPASRTPRSRPALQRSQAGRLGSGVDLSDVQDAEATGVSDASASPTNHLAVSSSFSMGSAKSLSKNDGDLSQDEGLSKSREELDKNAASKDQSWVGVFKKLQEHNEIHQDDLPRALELCGFVKPNAAWVQEILSGITQYCTVELDEFVLVMEGYTQKQHKACQEAFERADADGSGFVEDAELAELLRGFGIEPMSHVLEEVIHEVDEDGRGELDLEEFKHLMDLIVQREGFTKSEYEGFMNIYHRFDRDNSGEISTTELVAILNWLGYAASAQSMAPIIAEVDVDGSGEINEREYLICMRKVRERELNLVQKTMEAADEDGSGDINMDEVITVLQALGYDSCEHIVIKEAADDAGLLDEELDLGELWRLLLVYRNREGMSNAEVKAIDAAFNKQDRDRSGELTTLEATSALRELGYKVDFEVLQSTLAKVDVDDTGELDKQEFRKMVRMLSERDNAMFREVFHRHDTEKKGLSESAFREAMIELGYDPPRFPGKDEQRDENASLDTFVRICRQLAEDERSTFKQNGGWSDVDVDHFRIVFQRYDSKQTGEIANKELVSLIEDINPEMASNKAMRPQLLALMREVDQDGSGSLDFSDFLKLMYLFREFNDRDRVNKEQDAIKETGFSTQEVTEFRDLFLVGDRNEMNFQEFRNMIHQVTPLGDALTLELDGIFREVVCKNKRAEKNEADFPEFLLLWKKLLDMNFAGIKEKTSHFG